MFAYLLCVIVLLCSFCGAIERRSPNSDMGTSKVKSAPHRLRLCNAFFENKTIVAYHNDVILTKKPLKYKGCEDFFTLFKPDSEIIIKKAADKGNDKEEILGTFSITLLPSENSLLLLVITVEHKDSVGFVSHIFSITAGAQVAFIDTYKGNDGAGTMRISDTGTAGSLNVETLSFDLVVVVNPGTYKVNFETTSKKVVDVKLQIKEGDIYTVLRIGNGQQYPMALVSYPQSVSSSIDNEVFNLGKNIIKKKKIDTDSTEGNAYSIYINMYTIGIIYLLFDMY
eukprot:GHVL01014780.1.p1 GENE.GHVL01014780.1~~GHVL01014780.1.p1  ORF type:complete len:283 (+),score=54.40 GHVL01014780.1:61-909(+)